ncbi:MAG: extracellular solute-binding protein [Paracoccaceae bacterium]
MKTTLTSTLAISLALAAGAAWADGNLNIYAWSDSIDPALIEQFASEHGVTVDVASYQSNEDLLTKLQAGSSGYDIVMPSQHFVKIMVDLGLLQVIDIKSTPAYERIAEQWRGQWWDPDNAYSIPFALGTAGFAVNRDLYSGPIDSWSVYFEPGPDLAGKIGSLDYPDEVVGAAQLYLGVPFCSENPEEMKRVLDLLKAQKASVASYSSDNIEDRIGSGQVAAHFWWDGEASQSRIKGANVEYAMPKEGLVGWLDSLVVPVGAPNLDNAMAFIDFMSQPDHATQQANYYGHGSPITINEADAVNSPEVAPEIYPTVPVVFSQACSPAAQDLVTRVWTELLQ